jgi:hypothetical protein
MRKNAKTQNRRRKTKRKATGMYRMRTNGREEGLTQRRQGAK